jgi:hypothetical protein
MNERGAAVVYGACRSEYTSPVPSAQSMLSASPGATATRHARVEPLLAAWWRAGMPIIEAA